MAREALNWGAALLITCHVSSACTPRDDLERHSSGSAAAGGSIWEPDDPARGGSGRGSEERDAGALPEDPASDSGALPDPDEEPPVAGDATPGDTASPSVASSVPANGATGVRRETSLSVAFSEPMDRASVEAAFELDAAPDLAAEFHWDSGGRLLNIVLAAPLSYATGADANQVTATEYAFRFTSAARDLAGNALVETDISFATLREIQFSVSAEADPALTGNWRSDGVYGTDSCAQAGANICVGDSSFGPNAAYRGFFSFNLGLLPASLVELAQAEVGVPLGSILGGPFAGLGPLSLEHVGFTGIGPDAFAASAQSSLGGVATALGGDTLRFDALAAARADLTDGGLSQYRLGFAAASDADGATDLLFFSRGAVLRGSYLIP